LLLVVSVVPSILHAQIVVNFSPSIYGQTLDGLVYAQIMNTTGTDLKIEETIVINEVSGINVATIKTTPFVLLQGSNFISKAAFTNGRFNFGSSYYGVTFSQTGRLPEGEYEYCFQTEIIGTKPDMVPPFYENCFTLQLQPMTPLLLINPIDEDQICNKRPNLQWQLPAPLPIEARCRVILTEIQDKQDVAEAIAFNLPILNQPNIFGNILMYPAGAPELTEGHKYAWQVAVYSGNTILKKSDIWTFTVKCTEELKVSGDSYRELKETDDGNFYIANKFLRFSFSNSYNKGNLDYTIESLSNPQNVIKKLPILKMNTGINKYDIDLSENPSFRNGEEYLLKVNLVNGRGLILRFIYKNE